MPAMLDLTPEDRARAARTARLLDHYAGTVSPEEIERVRRILDGEAPDHDAAGAVFGYGSRMWSSNLRPCTVLYPADVQQDAFHGHASGRLVIWWETTDGLADWTRLAERHPSTRAYAPPADPPSYVGQRPRP
jgi:hypothetical protein